MFGTQEKHDEQIQSDDVKTRCDDLTTLCDDVKRLCDDDEQTRSDQEKTQSDRQKLLSDGPFWAKKWGSLSLLSKETGNNVATGSVWYV